MKKYIATTDKVCSYTQRYLGSVFRWSYEPPQEHEVSHGGTYLALREVLRDLEKDGLVGLERVLEEDNEARG